MDKLREFPSAEEVLLDNGYDDVIIFKNPSYDTALVGVSENNRAIYSYDKMIDYLMNYEDMTEDEACDFICYNQSFYYGENYPIIMYDIVKTIN